MKERRFCSECQQPRERCSPVVQHIDDTVAYVCPQCWRKLEYNEFMKEQR